MRLRLSSDVVFAIRAFAEVFRVAAIARLLRLPESTVRDAARVRTWRAEDDRRQPQPGRPRPVQLPLEPEPEEITAALEAREDLSLEAWPRSGA